MRKMVPLPVVGQMAPVTAKSMEATTARCVVSKSMTTVASMTSMTSMSAMTTVAATSHGQGNCRQN